MHDGAEFQERRGRSTRRGKWLFSDPDHNQAARQAELGYCRRMTKKIVIVRGEARQRGG